MAKEVDHIRLANHNHDLLAHLFDHIQSFPDWTATVAFYKAVHVVEAVLAVQSLHSTTHVDRENHLRVPKYKAIFLPFGHLYAASRIARYLEHAESNDQGARKKYKFSTFTDYMTAEDVRTLIRKKLNTVEQHACAFLSEQAKKDLKNVDAEQKMKIR